MTLTANLGCSTSIEPLPTGRVSNQSVFHYDARQRSSISLTDWIDAARTLGCSELIDEKEGVPTELTAWLPEMQWEVSHR